MSTTVILTKFLKFHDKIRRNPKVNGKTCVLISDYASDLKNKEAVLSMHKRYMALLATYVYGKP